MVLSAAIVGLLRALPLQEVGQLGDIGRDPAALIPGQHVGDLGVLLVVPGSR